jgi:molybdate transport system substrate-binding protein
VRAVLLAALLCASALAVPAGADPDRLTVYAAASLSEVVEALARRFPGARVRTSFGSSSELARQIEDGAPADVFLSASPDWIDFLREAGALAGEPVVIARNRLVCVAPAGSALAARGASGPAALLAALAPGDRVAIAVEGVPAGEYARKALAHLGLLDAYRPRLVGQKDVRAVLHAVEQGELPAGFVYATDARIARVVRLFDLDPASHPPIEYDAAALRGAPNPLGARRFLEYLHSETAHELLSSAGFALP